MRKSMLRRDSVQTKTTSALYHRIKPTAVALALATCFSGSIALANPVNPTVVNGTATFATAGNILNITNSHNAIINWGSFSIGVNELTRFLQQSSASAVLNRVIGQDPSAKLVGRDFVNHNIAIWARMIPVLDSGEHCPTHLFARKP